MSIEPGSKLGPYEIIAAIGSGGMGKLFQARDVRLQRTVAIKVLPDHLAENAEARERFVREARAISKVSHPRICALYDVGSEDRVDFLVLEYIDGETLAERLSRGALPLPLALQYGAQLADGLDAAHRTGIVHRDLKPANVMLTKAGVKILDFGLAKGVPSESADALTRERDLTREHALVGTLQYMAPEQLEGKAVDARTDLFALGAVLYEMLSGEKAFRGESGASLIASILRTDPSPLPGQARSLTRTIERCLAKDPDERWQTAKDLGEELRWIGRLLGESEPPAVKRGWWWMAAAALASAFVLGVVFRREATSPGVVSRLSVTLPVAELSPAGSVPFALSSNGRQLVYANSLGEGLELRDLDDFGVRVMPGTQNAHDPFFSPDGNWVGFFRYGDFTLYKASVAGGGPQMICRVRGGAPSGTWGPDGTIVFDSPTSGLYRVSADGGEPESLTVPDGARGEISYLWPQFLPDGRRVLFTAMTGEKGNAAVVSLETKETRILLQDVIGARYIPTGHLVYALSGELYALPFDLERGIPAGSPVRVESGIAHATVGPAGAGGARFAISDAGALAYAPGGARLGLNEMVWVDRMGRSTRLSEDEARYEYPQLSPDGKRIAVALHTDTGSHDVWIFDVERKVRTRLTFEGSNSLPFWTSNGKAVSFESIRAGANGSRIYRQSADGSGSAEPFPSSSLE